MRFKVGDWVQSAHGATRPFYGKITKIVSSKDSDWNIYEVYADYYAINYEMSWYDAWCRPDKLVDFTPSEEQLVKYMERFLE